MTSLIRIEYDVIMITKEWYHNGVTDLIMSVMLISVSYDTIVSNKHEEQTRHYYINFQHLHALASTIPSMTGESLDHLYMARVKLTHRTPLPVREGWMEVVQEPAAIGLVPLGPEHEEANNHPLSSATRFLQHLEEDLVPWHFDFTADSDGDFLHPHSLSQTIAHALRSGNPQSSFTPITQVLEQEEAP